MIYHVFGIYMTIMMSLFAYTGIKSTLRQIENNKVNTAFHINTNNINDTSFMNLFEENEYIHSIWIYNSNEKVIYYENNTENIPSKFNEFDTQWIKDCMLQEKKDFKWGKPFVYKDFILTPFVKSTNKGCIGIMYPFYL